jgi:hypothetical protein
VSEPYRRTQRGMLIYVAALLPLTFATFAIAQAIPFAAWLTGILGVLIAISFGSLTVIVDDDAVRLRFGIGIGRRTIPLSAIRSAKVVDASAISGIGIRWLGDGWLYNVAFGSVVELALDDGKRMQIGAPDPKALLAAIESRQSLPEKLRSNVVEASSTNWIPGVMIATFVVGFVGVMLFRDTRPVRVGVDHGMLTVDGGSYSDRVLLSEIRSATLEEQLPPIERRTNGFAFNGHLRGHFDVSTLGGNGMLFVERGHPPYLVLKTANSFVVLNFANPDVTRRLAEQLRKS